MAKTSFLWRVGRSIKAMIANDETASTEKRIEFSKQQVEKRDQKKKQGFKQAGYEKMMQGVELSKDDLKDKADHFRDMNVVGFSVYRFRASGLYKMTDEEACKRLSLMKQSIRLDKDLRWDFRLLDEGKLTYDDVMEKINDFKLLESEIMTPEAKRDIANKAGYLHPENMSDEQISDVAVDMEFTRRILRYSHSGYVSFRFYDKTIPERREFISGKERLLLLNTMKTDESIAVLDDKLMTYEKLREHYGRDMISVGSEKDWFRFKAFFENNDTGVIKPRFDSLGKGIKLLRKSDMSNMRETFLELIDEYRRFLMEGYINAAEEIKALNPDSVNTVRIIAYFDGKDTSIRSASMRIGKAGSFVDNAGAGGITVAIDRETGMIDSDGCDENGFIYDKHPDTGITFKGYQLPAWEKALAVVYDVSGKIEGAKYVGWDLACTSDHEWVIVEANGKTGFFGAQAPHDKGRRKEFLNTIGADPRGAIRDEVVFRTAARIAKRYELDEEELVEKIRHFESMGLDGRWFEDNCAWDLTDDEILELKKVIEADTEAGEKRDSEMFASICSTSGLDEDTVKHKYHLAKLHGYDVDCFLTNGIYLLSDEDIKSQVFFNRADGITRFQRRRKEEAMNALHSMLGLSYGRYSLNEAEAALKCGCSLDEYVLYGIYDKNGDEAAGFCTNDFMRRIWTANATGYESSRKLLEERHSDAGAMPFGDLTDELESIKLNDRKRLHIVTATQGGNTEVVMAAFSEGSDQTWTGKGFSAGVDVETGKIETERVNGYGERFEERRSKDASKGDDVPLWKEAASKCTSEAQKYPELTFMKWEVDVTGDTADLKAAGPVFDVHVIQMPYAFEGIGLRNRFEKYL